MPASARPSPEAQLKQATRESRGAFKIFLGAAPGVGKTFEMLTEGAQRLRAGIDVVVGVVETHGRAETMALTAPFEIVPRRQFEESGRNVEEMDLDAILARRPALVLVDELAHTNAAGSRHPKRWQDVIELLDAGIDVLTTVNVQHIESLNDVVASFTRVRVRETVPDSVFEQAEIEIVDLPPDELIERLKEGKVYVPEEASRALGHFFSKSNLSALRELALRRAAQAVDQQMLDHVRAMGEGGAWAAGERIVVAVSEQPGAESLVRTAKRIADAMHASWSAVAVETARARGFTDADRERLASALRLAASLGATIATVPADSVAAGIIDYVIETNATQVVIGKSRRSLWFKLRNGSVVDTLLRSLDGVAVHVIPASGERMVAAVGTRIEAPPFPINAYVAAVLLVMLTTAIAKLLEPVINTNAVDLLYLIPVTAVATRFGLRPGLLAGMLAVFAYNFFFLPPLYTLTVTNPQNYVVLLILMAVAVICSQFAERLRSRALMGVRIAQDNARLANLAQSLAAVSNHQATAQTIASEVARLFDVATILLDDEDGAIRIVAADPPLDALSPVDIAAAEWSFTRGEPAGKDTATLTACDWQFRPLKTSLGVLAVLGVARQDGRSPIGSDRSVLFAAVLGQAALAHERLVLEDDIREMHVLEERDKLRAALLSSISHDLRTPLTSVMAAAQALDGRNPDPALIGTIRIEAARLGRFFDDLIDMSRIEAGALNVDVEPIDLTDAVAAAAHDMRAVYGKRPVNLAVPPDLPLVRADARLLHHILINLLDNAAKYGAPGTPVIIEGRGTPDGLLLSVIDEGPGLPPGSEDAIFGTFARIEGGDRTGGTGLGLAIVKGFADAMGLSVAAANREEPQGAIFTIGFPRALLVKPQAPGFENGEAETGGEA